MHVFITGIRRFTLGVFFLTGFLTGTAQNHKLLIMASELPTSLSFEAESVHVDGLAAQRQVELLLASWHRSGYLAASIDSISRDSIQTTAYVFIGEVLKWVTLREGGVPKGWLEEMNIKLGAFDGREITPASYEKLVKRVLLYAENHGFPFAEVGLDSLVFEEDAGLSAKLFVRQNRFFVMDTLSLSGDAKVSKKFLYSYLGFMPGQPYNESIIQKMGEKLRRLPFVQQNFQQKIYFTGNKVFIQLELKERKTDQVDGLVGFAPNPIDNSLLVTGEANIDLKNLLRRGLAFDMHWKSFQARSQQLKLGGTFPYILQRPMGLDGRFEYVKFDTAFFTIHASLGVRYLFRGTDYVKFYYQKQSSALLSVDTSVVRLNKRIPTSNPVDARSYGVEINMQKLDYINNPRRGYRLFLNGNVGTRSILQDLRIERVVFYNAEQQAYNVYDSAKLKSLQGAFSYAAEIFIPIKTKSTLVTAISGKKLLAENIFFNDLYRFGGTKSLRGFNEESLVASAYTMGSVEFRYLFNDNSYFQIFANGAHTSKVLDGIKTTDWPIGFGTGVSLEVRSGLLSLAYAVGREQGNPIQLSNARIHFGIINYL